MQCPIKQVVDMWYHCHCYHTLLPALMWRIMLCSNYCADYHIFLCVSWAIAAHMIVIILRKPTRRTLNLSCIIITPLRLTTIAHFATLSLWILTSYCTICTHHRQQNLRARSNLKPLRNFRCLCQIHIEILSVLWAMSCEEEKKSFKFKRCELRVAQRIEKPLAFLHQNSFWGQNSLWGRLCQNAVQVRV